MSASDFTGRIIQERGERSSNFLCNIKKSENYQYLTKDDNREVYRKASGDWYAEVAKNNCVPGTETDCTDNSEGENDEDEESNAMTALVSCFTFILSLVL